MKYSMRLFSVVITGCALLVLKLDNQKLATEFVSKGERLIPALIVLHACRAAVFETTYTCWYPGKVGPPRALLAERRKTR